MRRTFDLFSSRVAQVGLVILLTGAAIVLADAEGGRQIADDAAVQRAAESVQSAAAVTDAAMRQAVVVARAWEERVADRDEVDAAETSLRGRMAELRVRAETLATLTEKAGSVRLAHAVYQGEVQRVADNLTSGDITTVWEETDAFAYASLAGVAQQIQDERQVQIINVREGVETVSAAARLFVGLGLPILILLLLYRALRQRQRQVILDEELRREKELRRAKDRFLNGASHHLNTPLTAVLGFAQLLSDGHRKFTASERSELIELLAIHAEEASHLAEDFLIAARSDMRGLSLGRGNVDLRLSVERAVKGWDGSELARLEISGNAVAVGDPDRVAQTIRNLLRNAVGYGAKNVTVSISRDEQAELRVADDGPGIPEGYEDKIFMPYYTRQSHDGVPPPLGLALAVARRLARAMDGDLTIHREASKNVFTLTLPAAEAPVATLAPDVVIDPTGTRPTPAEVVRLLERGGPPVIFQPIVDIKAHENGQSAVIGYEGLARFPYATPEEWFRVAEVAGRRLDLELSCIRAALEGFQPESEDQFVALNLTEEALASSRLVTALAQAPLQHVILELSETATIKNYQQTKRGLDRLRKEGVRLAIDDIGAAEIDLWHIVRLGASVVKLDMSLVTDLAHSPSSRGFVRALLAMAEELNIVLIGEGVETEHQHRALLELGVPFGQGFFYGRPHPLGEWQSWTVIAD